MYLYLFVFIGVFLIYSVPYDKKNSALFMAMAVMAVFFGLQYEVIQDWEVNIQRWNIANHGSRDYGREIEYLYIKILQFAKPLGLYGWLFLSSVLFCGIIYKYIKKYVHPSVYWVAFLVWLSDAKYSYICINSNRQTTALFVLMIAVYVLLEKKELLSLGKYSKYTSNLVAFVLIVIASCIHNASYVAFLLLPIYWFSNREGRSYPYIMMSFYTISYLGRFFIDSSSFFAYFYVSEIVEEQMIDGFDHYLVEFQSINEVRSLLQDGLYLIVGNMFLYYYDKYSKTGKFFGLCFILGYIGEGYLINTLSRVLLFLHIFTVLFIPEYILVTKKYVGNKLLVVSLYCLLAFYGIRDFYVTTSGNLYYQGWTKEYKTIINKPWIY